MSHYDNDLPPLCSF